MSAEAFTGWLRCKVAGFFGSKLLSKDVGYKRSCKGDRDAKLRRWPFLALGFSLRSGAK